MTVDLVCCVHVNEQVPPLLASIFLPGILLHVLSFSDFQLEWVFFSVIFDHH